MSKMQTSFEKVAKLESDVMSECKRYFIRRFQKKINALF